MPRRITLTILLVLIVVVSSAAETYATPEASNVALNGSSGLNLTTDDLICTYDLTDATAVAIAWYKNGSPQMALYLPFEGSSTSSQLDFSGNGHTVTSSGGPVWAPTGGPNGTGAYTFNVTTRFQTEAFPTSSSYTKAAWVYMTSAASSNNILSSQDITGGHVLYASQSQSNRLSAGQLGSYNLVQDPASLVVNQWYFVAVTFDYATGMMSLYKDDQLVDTATVPANLRDVTDTTVQIGSFANGSGWIGRIAEARVYNTALSSDQILALYHGSDTIKAAETTPGDTWQAEVTPFNSAEAGTSVQSNSLDIVAPPVVTDIPDQTISEGGTFATINLDDYVSDPDNTDAQLTWTYSGNTELTVDITSRVATISTPDQNWNGAETITFRATDPGGLFAEDAATFTVTAVNDPPVLAAIGPQSVDENVLLTIPVSATDVDGTTPTLTTSTPPTGAAFTDNGNGTGSFTWTPTFAQSGVYSVTFYASDGLATDSEVVSITVDDVNRPPVLAEIGSQSVNENTPLTIPVSAADPDGTFPALTTSTLPPGAVFSDNGDGTGFLNWTPSFDQSGAYPVTVYASDGIAIDSEIVTITVDDVNRPPVLADIGPQSVDENSLLTVPVSATDPDGIFPTLTTSTPPSGATFSDNGDGTGSLSWTPTFAQSGDYPVTFYASDGVAIDSEAVLITVNDVNQPPILTAIGHQSVDENTLLTVPVSATDPDGTFPTLTTSTPPTGASFIDNGDGTGSFSWTPTFAQSGDYPVTFYASDGIATDSEIVTITVDDVNRPPVLTAIGPQSVDENSLLTIPVSATDPDGTFPALTTSTPPSGASFIDNGDGAGSFSWTPTFAQSGVYPVTFYASDGTAIDSEAVLITVDDVNQPPVLSAIGPQSAVESMLLSFGVSASDPDGTTPALTTSTLPTGAGFLDNGDGTGSFNWIPTLSQSGVYPVTFYAADGEYVDSEVVSITVSDFNQAPVLASIGPQSTNEDELLSFSVSATDPDGTTPSLSTSTLPNGAIFTDNTDGTGTFNWTPSFTQAGSYELTFRASDGTTVDSEVVTITVIDVSGPPPSVQDVTLSTVSGHSTTDDDLFCTYTLGGEATTAAITWFKDGSPLLSLYLPFEGGSSNGLLDLSGHDHSVTAQGSAIAAWRGTMGHDGHGAFMFDPSFWLNAGEVFPVSSSYTKTAWVYMTGTGASNNILSSQDVTGGHVLYASQSQGNRLSAGQLGDWNLVQDPTPLVTDQWYFVGVSFDYVTGMMILYKDGVVVDTATVPPGERDITDQTLLVGTFSTGGGNGWLGLIDEARLYDYVLTPEQILALSHSADTITSTETEVDEVWQAEVTPFSASDLGPAVASNTLVIGQPTPWLSNVELHASSPDNTSADDLISEYSLGGTATTAAVAWYKDATPLATLYLPFEGSSASSQLDYSGHGQTVTAFGSPVWEPTGVPNGTGDYLFNGTNRLETEAFPTLSSYTKVAWVQMTDPISSNNILSSQELTGGHALWASQSQGNRLTAGQNGTWVIAQDPTPLVTDQWYFVGVTFDYATGMMVLYKDDQIVDTATVPIPLRDVTDATLQVGTLANGSGWKGRIAEARVYDFVLSPEQMLALYHGPDTVKSTETAIGEQWYAEITPFSSTDVGTTISTNTIQIFPESLLAPAAFNLEAPASNARLNINTRWTITFDWTDAVSLNPFDTTVYIYYLGTSESLTGSVIFTDSAVNISEVQVPVQGMPLAEPLYWRVYAINRYHLATWSDETWHILFFYRGDLDNNGSIDISDLVQLTEYMFAGSNPPLIIETVDIDCSGGLDISDVVRLVDYMFGSGPFPDCF